MEFEAVEGWVGVLTALAVLVSFGTITDGDACLKLVFV